jgi:hypothetical protein
MKFRRVFLLAMTLIAVALTGCGARGAQSNANAVAVNSNTGDTVNGAKTNAEELSLLIAMPYEAEDIAWKQSVDQKRITAVLRFDNVDTQKLQAEAEKFGPAESVKIEPQTWFPDELTAQSDLKGDSPLTGKAYPANQFFQDPYNSGKIVRVDGTEFYVLELTAK